MAEPAPDVAILTFNLSGAVLDVRPYRNNETLDWQVYFDTNRQIRDRGGGYRNLCLWYGFPLPLEW